MKHEIEYRGKGLMNKISQTHITVCGAGALGSNLIDSLARIGFTKLKVIDFDRVEPHNINNQLFDMNDVGNLKVAALQRKVYSIGKTLLDTDNKKLDATNVGKMLKGSDIVVDCFDNSTSRAVIKKFCDSVKLQCLHAGLVDDYGEVIWNENYRVPSDIKGDVCDYPLARNLVTVIVSMTCEEIVRFLDKKTKRNLGFSLEGMKTFSVT